MMPFFTAIDVSNGRQRPGGERPRGLCNLRGEGSAGSLSPIPGAKMALKSYTHVVGDEHRKAIVDLERLLFPNVPKFDESRNKRELVN
jgi:hypothetical protein